MHFSLLPWVLYAPTNLILLEFTTLLIYGKVTSYEAPHYTVFDSLRPLPPLIIPFHLCQSPKCFSRMFSNQNFVCFSYFLQSYLHRSNEVGTELFL